MSRLVNIGYSKQSDMQRKATNAKFLPLHILCSLLHDMPPDLPLYIYSIITSKYVYPNSITDIPSGYQLLSIDIEYVVVFFCNCNATLYNLLSPARLLNSKPPTPPQVCGNNHIYSLTFCDISMEEYSTNNNGLL